MNVILRAEVTGTTGKVGQTVGAVREGMPITVDKLPVPSYVCVAEEEDGWYLLHFNATGESFADTWHDSLAAAKKQAQFEFGISEPDWERVSPQGTGAPLRTTRKGDVHV